MFKSYVETIYKLKKKAKTPTDRELSKSLMNNLLGRFGLSLSKPVTTIVTPKELIEIGITSDIIYEKHISKSNILVSYESYPNSELMSQFNVDITKAFFKLKHLKNGNLKADWENIKIVNLIGYRFYSYKLVDSKFILFWLVI